MVTTVDGRELLSSIDLAPAEFALLGRCGTKPSLVFGWAPAMSEADWAAIGDGLWARGVLEPTADGQDLAVAAAVVPLLWAVAEAEVALELAEIGDGELPRWFVLRAGDTVVRHGPTDDGLHRVELVDGDQFADEIVSALGLDRRGSAGDGANWAVGLDQGAGSSDLDALADRIGPTATTRRLVLRVAEPDGEVAVSDSTWVDRGEGDLLAFVLEDAELRGRSVAPHDLALAIREALAPSASAGR